MSGYNYEPDFSDQENSTGGGLRKQLEDALSEIRSLRTEMASGQREASATSALTGAGLDPALAQIIPADADPKAWVEQYASLLGARPSASAPEELEEEPTVEVQIAEEDPALTAEREARQQMDELQQTGLPAIQQSQLDKLANVNSEAEMLALIEEAARAAG